jgi:hypothetical protein
MSGELMITKEDFAQGVVAASQTKMGAATIATGTTGAVTGFIEGIGPYIPFAMGVAAIIFGCIHVWLHWKELKAQERKSDGTK